MSKLFDDSSLAMIPSAVKDGKLYSIRPTPEYGAEEVTNGDFATDSNWTKETGWTISGGKASYNGSAATNALYQNISAVSGTTYRVSFSVVNYVSGSFKAFLSNGSATGSSPLITANGDYVFDMTATGILLVFRNDTSFNGSIDNVSVQEIVSSGDFTFSRGSNLAATRVDVNGLIEKGRENLLLQSNQFDTTWESNITNREAVVSGGEVGYDGSNDAWLVLDTTGSGRHQIASAEIAVSGVNVASVYAKAYSNSRYLALAGFGMAAIDETPVFDLENGTIDMPSNSTIIKDATITSVGNGWYRCSIMFLYSGTSSFFIALSNSATDNSTSGYTYTGTGTNGFYIQDAQLESGLVATDVISTGASTAQAGILEDLPRLDYSGGASCPSLLLEPQRSNLIIQSEYYNGSDWSATSTTITSNSTISPEGLVNATKLVPNNGATNADVRTNDTANVILGQKYVFSTFAKKGEFDKIQLDFSDSRFGDTNVIADLTNGTITAGPDNVDEGIEDYGNGWYRIYVVGEAIANGTTARIFRLTDNGTGDGTSGIYVYGAQWEDSASYPTSYIPTYGSAVTRSGDVADGVTIDTTANHTLLYDFNGTTGRETSSALFNIGYDNSNRYFIKGASSSSPQFQVSGTGIFSGSINPTNEVSGRNKIAVQWIDGTGYVYSNGVKQSGTLTNTSSANDIDYYKADGRGYSHEVNQLVIFNTALTDSECIALTSL